MYQKNLYCDLCLINGKVLVSLSHELIFQQAIAKFNLVAYIFDSLPPAEASCEKGGIGVNVMEKGLTLTQRITICFSAGVIGGLAVVLFGRVLFEVGLSATFGVKAPISLNPPDIYRPLFWGGLWGIPFGFFIKAAWKRLYLAGFLYFLAPVLALYTIFLPMRGAGYFGLQQGGPMFTIYLLLVNLPYGIITALAARAIIGKKP